MNALIGFIGGFALGAFCLLGYIIKRMMSNLHWDQSNMTNALRLLSHVCLHPEDFGKMWYVQENGVAWYRPFWYVDKDELSDVVKTRPRQ